MQYRNVGGKRHFLYRHDEAQELLRDDFGFRADAINAKESNTNVFGIKEYSPLLNLSSFLPSSGSVIDQLHCLGGVAKKLISLMMAKYQYNDQETKEPEGNQELQSS